MTTEHKLALGVIALLAAFACGRYSVQAPTIKTTEVSKTDTKVDENKDTHETIVTTKTPKGDIKTVETIDSTVHEDTTQDNVTQIQQTITPPKTGTLNISGLIGNDFSKGLSGEVYGASVTKEVLGPVSLGAWGLTNGTVGLSIGLSF